MPVLWDSKVKFVCFSVLGVSLVLPLWICLWTFHNSISYCLAWGKKKEKERGKKKNKPPADFKPGERVLLVFLDDTGRGGLGLAFLPCYGFSRIGARPKPQYSQLPSLQPKSSMSCQASTVHLRQACAFNPPVAQRSMRYTSSMLFSSP